MVEDLIAKTQSCLSRKFQRFRIDEFVADLTVSIVSLRERDQRFSKSGIHDVFCTDVVETHISQLHDDVGKQQCRHVMILGEAGSGKTILSCKYAQQVSQRKIDALRNVHLVHHINYSDLCHEATTTAFNLIFTNQLSGERERNLLFEKRKICRQWVDDNCSEILLCIDNLELDQIHLIDEKNIIFNSGMPVKPYAILASILSGGIWPKMRILTTARWSIYWDLIELVAPDKVVRLQCFNDYNLRKAIGHCLPNTPRWELIRMIQGGSQTLQSFFSNPMFLPIACRTYAKCDTCENDSNLAATIFYEFLNSPLRRSWTSSKSIQELSYRALHNNQFVFSAEELKFAEIDTKDLEGFVEMSCREESGILRTRYIVKYSAIKVR